MANVNSRRAKEALAAKKEKQKKILIWIAVGLVAALCITGMVFAMLPKDNADDHGHDHSTSHEGHEHIENTAIKSEADYNYIAEITIKDHGTIKVGLHEDKAPITVENFVSLAESGFYDGLTFHRIISGFMMQGGDPEGTGFGGSEKTIKGEFTSNGVENDLSHTRGAISMARSNDKDSASSQFFIMHEDGTSLDGNYAVFGYTLEGIEIVDEICYHSQPTDDNGTIPAANQPVIETVKIIRQNEAAK